MECKLFITHYHSPHFSPCKIISKNHRLIQDSVRSKINRLLILEGLCTSSDKKPARLI